MESNSNTIMLRRIHTDSTVVYRVNISESDIRKVRKSILEFDEVVKIESLLCKEEFKSMTTIGTIDRFFLVIIKIFQLLVITIILKSNFISSDGSSITRRGNHSWICTSVGGFICRKFECHNESGIYFYQVSIHFTQICNFNFLSNSHLFIVSLMQFPNFQTSPGKLILFSRILLQRKTFKKL